MRKLALLAVFVLSTLVQPARAQFCPGVSPWVFDDVLASDPFCGFITWMADNGITVGCQTIDPLHRLYCPADNVTRKQMAAFMKRLGDVRVEAVDTGPGLLGGPITSTGTITLAATQLLPTVACANNQIARWNGSAWACANDANSGGTVTSVASGAGLSGGPITSSGTLSIASGYQLPQGCTNGQVAKSNGAGGWTCQNDANSGGTVTSVTAGAGLTGGTITTSGTIAVDPASTTLTNNFFRHGGNTFGGTAVLGTTDNSALDLRVNGSRVMRYEPNALAPNVIGGHVNNSVGVGLGGQTVAGGGTAGSGCFDPPTGTFTRSCGNHALASYAAVGGGIGNRASTSSVIAGGQYNTASGFVSTVAGGISNTASSTASTVAGGESNVASGTWSFAAGRFAKTQTPGGTPVPHDGAFVWSDSNNVDFNSGANNEFAARATGGVRFVTAIDGSGIPTRTVKINPNGELDFGTATRQMLNLSGAQHGIGVQPSTQYYRSDWGYAWFVGGTHSNVPNDPGSGGEVLMTLELSPTFASVVGTARAQDFVSTSDRNVKTAFAPADTEAVLAKVASLPVATWAFRNNPTTRHIGPVAQDFHAAFGLGSDDRTISAMDQSGVALAAIKGLNAKLDSANAKIEAQARELEAMRERYNAEVAALTRMVEVLMARVSPDGQVATR